MQQHNGIIEEKRESDFIAGTNSPLQYKVRLTTGDWTPYLPDFDRQKINGLETEACVPFTAVESIETQINWMKATGQLPQSTIDTLTKLGFFEANGQFHASERFIAKLDGTNHNGTSLPAPWDAIRKYGLIPFTDWPFDESITTWEQFYTAIPQALLDKGKQFLQLFRIDYEYVQNGGQATVGTLAYHLKHAPLCLGAPVCEPWDLEQPPTCPLTQPTHSTLNFYTNNMVHILDHYAPFEKELAATYPLPYAMKGIVTVIPPTPIPVIPLPAVIQPTQQNVDLLTLIRNAYQAILAALNKGRQLSSENMNYSLLRSKTFYTLCAQFAFDVWQLLAPSVNPAASAILNVVFFSLASYFHLSTGLSTTGSN